MPPRAYESPTRTAAAERTRARIVAAAAKVLRSSGTGAFSLESVARIAKVTRLTVYNQFGSRRALLEAVFDDRATRGGLIRLREAMSDPDPHAGLERLIAIFCDFWDYDRGAIARLHGMGAGDAEFEESIRARNERRRSALSVLVGRIAAKNVTVKVTTDLTDLLFVLTSFAVFAELTAGRRTKDGACALIQVTARSAVERAKSGR